MDISVAEKIVLCALLVPPKDEAEARKQNNSIFTTFSANDFTAVLYASDIFADCEKVYDAKKIPTIAAVRAKNAVELAYVIKREYETTYRYSIADAKKTLLNRRKVKDIEKILEKYHRVIYDTPLDEINPDELLHDIRTDARQLHDGTMSGTMFTTLADIMGNQLDVLMKKQAGEYPKPISSGITELDNALLGGFHKAQMISICARPSVGKSQVGWFSALQAAKSGHKVLYVNLEMNDEQIGTKGQAYYSGINSGKLDIVSPERPLQEDEWNKIYAATTENEAINKNIIMTKAYTYNMEDLSRSIQTLKDDNKCDIVFIDYLGLMQIKSMPNADEYKLVTAISRKIKGMALEYDIPMVALVQLNRAIDKEEGRTPRLSDIRSSGAIEQDSDVVVFLDVVTNPEDKRIKSEHQNAVAEWMRKGNKYQYMIFDILKQRGGQRNTQVRSIVEYATNRFYDPARYIDFT